MASEVVWDARVVTLEQDSMGVLAYIPEWENLQFSDSINEQGYGTITFDFDSPWLADFYTAQSKYPWEGIYGVQFLRDGTLVYTFICEEAEIQYVGPTRRVALGGRGLAGCLEWGIVLPEGFDESLSDPDDPDNVLFMTRGFGSVATNQSDIDAGNYSVDSPQHKAYGGGAFVHLFQECDTGNAQTWSNITTANANRTTRVTWPLSLSTHLDRNTDSNDVTWATTATYPAADVTNLFEISAGLNMFDVLLEACSLTANSQWNVKPDGTIHIAKQIGTDRSGTILLSIPQAQTSSNSLNSKDSRSFIYASNGYLFEQQSSAASVNRFGRREGFVDADQSEGQLVSDIAKHALEEVKDQLDEFSFAYYETADSEAFIDFAVGDTVNIEYEPGVVNARQVTALSASVSSTGSDFEVTVGDVVENAIAVLNKKDKNNQNSHLITTQVPGFGGSHPGVNLRRPVSPPSITSVTPKRDGVTRSVTIAFKTPGFVGTQSLLASKITGFEAEVYLVSDSTVKHTSYKAIDRTSVDQTMVVTGMGERGSSYRARVRAVSKERPISEFAISDAFNLTDSGEGGVSDPYKPGQVSGVTLFPMLNAILVRFTDFTGSTNPTVSGPRGKYEIQISNASGGANFGSGNTWTRTIGGNTSGESATSARTFVVPDGSGFICTGLLSEVGGRTHYVRVRAVNWDGSTGDYSATASVSLDTSDESQVGVVIGEDSITATNILAGTITATQISAGTITADRMNADQVITSAIRMPQPSGASNAGALADGTSGNEIKFSIDKDGNMWWGNFTTYANAVSRTIASGSAGNDYVMTRFKGDGSEYVIGTPNQYVGFTSSLGAYSKALSVDGSATIDGTLTVNSSTGIKAGNTSLNSTRIQFGTNPYVTIDHSAGSFFGGSTPAIKWGSTIGGSQFGYIAGGSLNLGGFGAISMIAMGINNSNVIFSTGGAVGFLTGSGSHITLDGDNGIVISDNGVPSSTSGRLYRNGSTLYWNGSEIGGGMDIAGLSTSTPGDPASTFVAWSTSSSGSEKKMTVTTLASEINQTGLFVSAFGDSMSGALTMSNGSLSKIQGNGNLYLARSSSADSFLLSTSFIYAYANFMPSAANSYDLGQSWRTWEDLYVDDILNYGSYNFYSDENAKTDISNETKGLAFVNSLRPVTFKWKEVSKKDGSGEMRAGVRTHHGFIAQEVETALASEAANDALWVNMHQPALDEILDDNGNVIQPAIEESYKQGLRMTEFIAPIVKAIQELSDRVEALEG